MVKLNVYIIAAAIAAIVVGGAVSYYKISSNRIEELTLKVNELQIALQSSNAVNEKLAADQQKQFAANTKLETALNESEKNLQNLRSILAEHDLEFLALNKPNLIEERINNATKKIFTDLERVTSDSE